MSLIPSVFGRRNNVFDPFSIDGWDPFKDWPFNSAISGPICSDLSNEMSQFAAARIDWKETPKSHVFEADLPVLKKEEVKVEVEDGNVLHISGERSREKEEKKDTWHWMERRGTFEGREMDKG